MNVTPLFGKPTAPVSQPLFGGAPAAPKPALFQDAQPATDLFTPTANPAPATPPTPVLAQATESAAHNAALAALPPSAASALREVWDALPGSHENLDKLLQNGTLAQPAVAERLAELVTERRAPGLDSLELATQAVATLAEPDDNGNVYQGKRYTCGAANVQRELADQPGLFLEVVEGLSSPKGEAPLGLRRVPHSEEYDGSGRSTLNRLVQGALMQAGGSAEHGQYDPLTDKYTDESQGLKLRHTAALTAALEHEGQVIVVHDGGTHDEFAKIFNEAKDIQLGVSWNGTDHMLLMHGIENGTATYFNPQEGRTGQMPAADLLFKTQAAIFPEHQLAGTQFPDDAYVLVPQGGTPS